MKRILSMLMIIVVTAGLVRAEEGKPMTNAGNTAALFSFSGLAFFGIGGLFNVGWPTQYPTGGFGQASGGGGNTPMALVANTTLVPGIGLRYYLANNMALRAGIGFGSVGTTTKNGDPTLSDNTTSASLLGIQALLEVHLNGFGSLSPYLGGGVGFQSASVGGKTYFGTNSSSETKTSATTINIGAMAGFEWFVMNRVSLGAEYQLQVSLLSGSSTVTSSNGSTSTETTKDLPSYTTISTNTFAGNNALSVILSFYP